uniref:uncharacterized protein LOC122598341 n=1 Tax=Erigeron canadensis TaxID=72917 RepID=UPI001CB8F48B|nr:uncharacterized protein LOC122598341 [Erigeron canadensis]
MADNNGEISTVTSGYGGDAELPTEYESMLTWLFSTENDGEDGGAIDISKLLEASPEKPLPRKVKIINDLTWHPSVHQTASSSYITINGNEELCGSSFSDSDATHMVGIAGFYGCGGGLVVDDGAWDSAAEEARGWFDMEMDGDQMVDCLVNGEDGEYLDDQMLANFLGEDFDQSW